MIDLNKPPTRKKPSRLVLFRLYVTHQYSLNEVAEFVGYSQNSVRNWLKEYLIPSRGLSDARLVALKKGKISGHQHHPMNDAFFQTWSPQMAWILGLFFTDGYLIKNRLRLSLIDKGALENVAHAIDFTGDITKRKNGPNYIYDLIINRESIANDLRRLGVHQAKSFTIKFPDIPSQYLSHFIRGCWDGDGGVTTSTNNVMAYYTCGSRPFVQRIVEILFNEGIHRIQLQRPSTITFAQWDIEKQNIKAKYPYGKYPLTIHKRRNTKSFDLRIKSPDSLKRLFFYLYDGVDKSIYMERKYKTFLSALEQVHR